MLNKIHWAFIVFTFLILSACQQPAQDQTASPDDAPETVSAADSELSKLKSEPGVPRGYVVDGQNSVVKWQGSKKLGAGKHNGTLKILGGKLVVRDGLIAEGEFRIDMNSLHTTDFEEGSDMYEKLVGHLKGPDFFDVEQYPVATFRIKSFEPFKNPSSDANYNVNGTLEMKDVSEMIFFPALIQVEGNKIKAGATLNIDRSKWNVKYGSEKFFDLAKDEIISDNIIVELSIVTI